MSERIYLSPPHLGGSEINYINEALSSNWIAPVGSNIDTFENKLEHYLGDGNFVAALNSGTSAIHLALILLGVTKGDEVLIQSNTHIASVNPVLYLGAIPIFIDSEIETWNLCPNFLEDAIKSRIEKGKKPKAIITVDLYGMPYKVDEIKSISLKYEIPILEDAAEALGSSYKNKKCGTFGDISILSFNGNKIITTSAGGALVSNNKKIKEKTIFLANQAKENVPYFQHKEVGYNYRISNICAGIGCGQMEMLDQFLESRKANNVFYTTLFNEIENVTVQKTPSSDYESNFWLSTILFEKNKNGLNEKFRLYLESHNIESRRLWKPMHMQPLLKNNLYFGSTISENLFNNGLCLPSGYNIGAENKIRIKNLINSFFNINI